MDALGLLSLVVSASGMNILTAGASVSAPSEAQFAIVCLPPVSVGDDPGTLVYASQAGMCSKGGTIRFVYPRDSSSALWSWGTASVKFNHNVGPTTVAITCVIYLG